MTVLVVRDIKDEGAESTRIAAMFSVHHTKKCIFAPTFTLFARYYPSWSCARASDPVALSHQMCQRSGIYHSQK